jgi:uncharacterized protein (DUF2461 family)
MPFTKRALGFFRGLARNNEKPWFEAHRDEYETEVRGPMRDLIADLDTRFAEFAPEIGGDPKRSMFRINQIGSVDSTTKMRSSGCHAVTARSIQPQSGCGFSHSRADARSPMR